jgi:hypothetical protein|tara:strand:- start:131 stop:325 length:195 start_codon:yes stop_codon:yes gene_type:complete
MSVPINYSTGWYSISPAFAWWNNSAHRLAEIKTRKEAERIIEKDKRQKKINTAKIAEGTISIYA